MGWMLTPYARYLDFSGRSRRREYWSFVLFQIIVFGVGGVAFFATSGSMMKRDVVESGAGAGGSGPWSYSQHVYTQMGHTSAGGGVVMALLGLFWLFNIIPSLAVTVRRLHDRGMSGWWYVGFVLLAWVPLIGAVAGIALFVVLLQDGERGPNKWGDDPKRRGLYEVFR